jgi:hypothetical protein
MLQQYEEDNQSSFISLLTWRKAVTYLTVPIAIPIACGLSKFIQAHNMMASNNLGLFQYLGILSIPILAPLNQWPLAINDFIYSISGFDWVLNDFKALNYLFGTTATTQKNHEHKAGEKKQQQTPQTKEVQSQTPKQKPNEEDEEYTILNIEDIENYLTTLGDDPDQEEDPFTFQ